MPLFATVDSMVVTVRTTVILRRLLGVAMTFHNRCLFVDWGQNQEPWSIVVDS